MTRLSNPVRLSLASAATFALVAVGMPFWPLWLTAHGVTPQGIGLLAAVTNLVRVAAGPGFSYVADHIGDRRAPFIWLSLAHFIALGGFVFTGNIFWAIMLVSIIATSFGAPLMPLLGSLTMAWSERQGYDYGRIRLWGSVSFIVITMGAGVVIAPFGVEAVLFLMMGTTALMAASGYLLPHDPRKGETASHQKVTFGGVMALMSDARFIVFVLASSLVMASHATYYAFGSINWERMGYSTEFIGFLWALGVMVEIVLFAFSGRLFKRFSPAALTFIGCAAAVVRWTGTAFDPHWTVLILLQCLHGFTFGAVHLAVMQYLSRSVPIYLAATAQGLYAAVSAGVFMGLVSLAAGPAFDEWGARSYLFMTALGALGAAASVVMHRQQTTRGEEDKTNASDGDTGRLRAGEPETP